MDNYDEAVQPSAEAEGTAPAAKRRQRKPWTEEQKKAAAEKRAERKSMAENLQPGIFVQFGDLETNANGLVEAAKAEFRKEKKRAKITEMELYIKPEERAAYYVINGTFSGKLPL